MSAGDVDRRAWLLRDDAFRLAASLAEVGVYVTVEGSPRGWRVTIKAHTELVDLAKVIDAFKVNVSGSDEPQPLHALYRRFGGEEYPEVLIYYGSKP